MGRYIDKDRISMPKFGKMKVGTFTHDISATGTQSVTGVGFKPRKINFIAGISESVRASIGFDDGTLAYSIYPNGAANFSFAGTRSIFMKTDASNYATAYITSIDEDGFTITWGKTGSPTGTASVAYWAEM